MTDLVNIRPHASSEKLSLGLLGVVALWSLVVALTGSTDFLLYVAPAVVIAFPLAFGRYVGEATIARLKGYLPTQPRPATTLAPHGLRTEPRTLAGLLIASSLAGRAPPPAYALN